MSGNEVVAVGLEFEFGSAYEAKGHALVYFRNKRIPESIVATYVVVLPVSLDLSKYIPPMLASQIPQVGAGAVPFVAVPPIPEPFDSHESLKRTASIRDDDLVFGGAVDLTAVETTVVAELNQIAQTYANLYKDRLSRMSLDVAPEGEIELGVSEVLYSLMAEKDKLSELAKLTGKLRYALDGSDRNLAEEAVQEMETLAQYLPEKYRVKDLIRVAQLRNDVGGRLADLYISRCYRLSNEEYTEIEHIDRAIRELESQT